MTAHIAYNDIARQTTSQLTSVTGTATATAVSGEPIASAATRPLRRSAAWTVAGGASGGTVRIRLESAPTARTIRVVTALALELPASGVTSVNALIRSGTSTVATGTTLAAADFSRPYDSDRAPWNVAWTFSGTAGDGVELVITLAASASGTVRIGRLWASESLTLSVAPGWSRTIDDTSVIQYGPQGRTPSVYEGETFRRYSIPLTVADEASVTGAADLSLADWDALLAYLGQSRDCILIPSDTTAQQRQRLPLYGLIERAASIPHAVRDFYSASLEVAGIR
jgi:hypothetical protein